jgi:hypothetical protein
MPARSFDTLSFTDPAVVSSCRSSCSARVSTPIRRSLVASAPQIRSALRPTSRLTSPRRSSARPRQYGLAAAGINSNRILKPLGCILLHRGSPWFYIDGCVVQPFFQTEATAPKCAEFRVRHREKPANTKGITSRPKSFAAKDGIEYKIRRSPIGD